MPKRIQRQRTKGWRMPEGVVYVGRPSKWGNPFVLHDWQASFRAAWLGCRGDKRGRLDAAVKIYRLWLTAEWKPATPEALAETSDFWKEILTLKPGREKPTREAIRADLCGKTLACWCPLDQPCHADVLLEIANA